MEDDSLDFGDSPAGATPGANSILAQPQLQDEDGSISPGQGHENGQGDEAGSSKISKICVYDHVLTR
jgi:hypothetical protein